MLNVEEYFENNITDINQRLTEEILESLPSTKKYNLNLDRQYSNVSNFCGKSNEIGSDFKMQMTFNFNGFRFQLNLYLCENKDLSGPDPYYLSGSRVLVSRLKGRSPEDLEKAIQEILDQIQDAEIELHVSGNGW